MKVNNLKNKIKQENVYNLVEQLNQISEALSYLQSCSAYSLTEHRIGTWIDGKPVYRTVINLGNLSSSVGAKGVAHHIANIDFFTNVYGIVSNNEEWFNFNSVYRGLNSNMYDLGLLANKTDIIYSTQTDRHNYSGIVVLEYTKTTD